MTNNPPPSSFHLSDVGMLTRSRRNVPAPSVPAPESDGLSSPPLSPTAFLSDTPESPIMPTVGGSSSSRPGSLRGRDSDASNTSSTGATRSNINPSTGKRKRSRVTPAQLAHLERVFAKDRSPTAARRKELADLLSMNERQTQVWFQNRRAKAKLLEQRARAGRPAPQRGDHSGSSSGGSYNTGASGEAGVADVLNRIHEEENVFIIPCSDLCIGTFRRVSAGLNDLIGYTCESKRLLAWYVYSAGTGFKMEVPFSSIVRAEMSEDATAGHSRAVIYLSHSPGFAREFPVPGFGLGAGGTQRGAWQPCEDWTENRQASSILVHIVVGSTQALEFALGPFLPSTHNSSENADEAEDQDGEDEVDDRDMQEPVSAGPRSARKRQGSGISNTHRSSSSSPVNIQTPSLHSVLPSPISGPGVAPPSAYRDPFSTSRPPFMRRRSRSNPSSPFEYDTSFDYEQAFPMHQHPLVSPSASTRASFSGNALSAMGAFAQQQDEHPPPRFDPTAYSGDLDHIFSTYQGGQQAQLSSGGPSPSTGGLEENYFGTDAAGATVPIAKSFSSSSKPGTSTASARSNSLSHSHSPYFSSASELQQHQNQQHLQHLHVQQHLQPQHAGPHASSSRSPMLPPPHPSVSSASSLTTAHQNEGFQAPGEPQSATTDFDMSTAMDGLDFDAMGSMMEAAFANHEFLEAHDTVGEAGQHDGIFASGPSPHGKQQLPSIVVESAAGVPLPATPPDDDNSSHQQNFAQHSLDTVVYGTYGHPQPAEQSELSNAPQPQSRHIF